MDDIVKSYYITEDLPKLMQQWCKRKNYEAPKQPFFDRLKDDLKNDVQTIAFSEPLADGCNIQVKYLPMSSEVFDGLRKKDDDNSFWIALDDVYIEKADAFINATRIFHHEGDRLGEGRRTDHRWSVRTQIAMCADLYTKHGRPKEVVLADDGAYNGETIIDMIGRLDTIGIKVTQMRLAFATGKAFSNIQTYINGRESTPPNLQVGMTAFERGIHDWVCERDFYAGVPRSGRTIGFASAKEIAEFEPYSIGNDEMGIGYPYVEPMGDMPGGASILRGRKELSARLINHAIRLWGEIESINHGLQLKVKDLPRFPGPGCEQEFNSVKDMRVVKYFKEAIKHLEFAPSGRRRPR